MKDTYRMTKEEVLEGFGTEKGLSDNEAARRLLTYGANALQEGTRKSIAAVFISQFADLLVIILIVAAIISMLSGNVESSIVILVVILLNAILGTLQYCKAEKSLDALKELSAPKAKVLRNGVKTELVSSQIVPGDVVLLEAGDLVAADARILRSYSLQVNESALTGESAGVDKKDIDIADEVGLGDRCNMVFSGSLVTYGRAEVLVTATGMQTEIGKIAALMNQTKNRKTPLQLSLDEFGRKFAVFIMAISILVFALRLWQGEPVLDSLMFAVALSVAAIPEALSSIVTIVQAMGTRRMVSDHAIIKELGAVESLGCVSVICSDKTGTLTQNRMTVQLLYLDGRCIRPQELDLTSQLSRYFLYTAILNNDSSIRDGKDIGDPTETCLLCMAREAGLDTAGISEEDIRDMMTREDEIPFDSDRKLMSTKYRVHGVPTIFTKGAVDVLSERLTHIATSDGVRPITAADLSGILRQNQFFSENGLRVLAFAYRECPEAECLCPENEYGYTFIGLVSMMDPPREESRQAVADAFLAGIKPVMITGDHKVTATAIARQIGIFREEDLALAGQELDRMSDEELDAVLDRISVYARVSPENKIRIVDAWQRKGHIVAMTGDGVNDAPALKKADIGVAMGITGTEVSKDAAAMILADDNFATILHAVQNGRNVYRNIKNAILFLLSGNLAAILVVLLCSFFALPTPFEPVHLLFINLLTDSLPALAIGMEPMDASLLRDKPRNPKEGILNRPFTMRLSGYGLLIAIVTFAAYYQGLFIHPRVASTMAFATLTLARLFHGFNCRSRHCLLRIGIRTNRWCVAAFFAGVLLLFIVFSVPILHNLFMVYELSGQQLLSILVLSLLPTVIIQSIRIAREASN